jgi:hypothetical protein
MCVREFMFHKADYAAKNIEAWSEVAYFGVTLSLAEPPILIMFI